VRGLPEMSIKDMYLENMVLKAAKGAELTAAENISLKNIRLITTRPDPVVYVENSKDLLFDDIQCNPGTALPFSINGDRCVNILVTNTDVRPSFSYGASASALEIKKRS
jgi:hypothetical protein